MFFLRFLPLFLIFSLQAVFFGNFILKAQAHSKTIVLSKEKLKNNPDFLQLEETLNSIKTVKGAFVQEFAGKQTKAEFFLKLPSKFKVEYFSPEVPVIIITTKNVLTYYDKKLEQKSQITTPKTASTLLLTTKLSLLDDNIEILSFNSNKEEVIVKFVHHGLAKGNEFKAFFRKVNGLTLYKLEQKNNLAEQGQPQNSVILFDWVLLNQNILESTFHIQNKSIDAKFDF